MRSQKQKEASRANGAHSRGPVTPEGKRRSSQNARKHGLLAQHVLVGEESPDEFENAMEEHIAVLKPANNVELTLVENVVSAFWRTRRLWAIESRLLDDRLDVQLNVDEIGRLAAAFSALAASGELALLERYEARLHRMYRRSIQNLQLLREMEQPDEPGRCEESILPNEPEPSGDASHVADLLGPQPPETCPAPRPGSLSEAIRSLSKAIPPFHSAPPSENLRVSLLSDEAERIRGLRSVSDCTKEFP